MIHQPRQLLGTIVGLTLAAACQAECAPPQLIAPVAVTITDARTRFEWNPVPGATGYQLWIESRVPEGRVLATQNLRTAATYWIAPDSLTENNAVLKIRIGALCGKETSRIAGPFRVFIDLTLECVIHSPLTMRTNAGVRQIQWSALKQAREYGIEIWSAMDASLLSTTNVYGTSVNLEALPKGIWIVGVKPRCGAILGSAKHLTVASP
ncbi:MAG: hypothetical protein ACKVQA_12115 [Burkholderiales bacterium]